MLVEVGGSVGDGGMVPPKCLVSFMWVVSDWRLEKLSLHQTQRKMSLLLSGPRLSHCDCHADGLEPAGSLGEAADEGDMSLRDALEFAARAAAAAAALPPLAISLILSKGFLGLASRPLGLDNEAAVGGRPPPKEAARPGNFVSMSGVRVPAARRGLRKGQAAPRADEAESNFGIFGLAAASSFFTPPDKSSGDSASLGEAVGDVLWPADVRLRTPAAARAAAVAGSG